jgi:hypothetical protein
MFGATLPPGFRVAGSIVCHAVGGAQGWSRFAGQHYQLSRRMGSRDSTAVKANPGQITYVVRDEGPGFDPSILPDPTDPANLEQVGGRGLLLIRTFMNKVYHNERGNEITLIKDRDR